jgi:hypothetical protein
MDEDEYLKDRLEDQIGWYSKKSQTNQKWFKNLRLLEIVLATLIPFLAGIGDALPCYQTIIGGIGVVIAIAAGLSAINKYQENWIEYRTTAESLKHEKYLYKTKCKPYDSDGSLQILVQNVESLISKENSQWSKHSKNDKQT